VAVHEICSVIGFPSGYVESQRRASNPFCWILRCLTSWTFLSTKLNSL